VVAALVVGTAIVVLVVLWRWIDGLALTDMEKRATAQLDAVKVAASIAVGGGGLFALYLAARRQRTQELELDARHDELDQRDRVQAHIEQVSEINRAHAERVAEASERDATDRRITELYAKSVEQLGSDKAPVRLGGLYALERLAQDNPHQRPTAVDVLCAYLRMPYTPPTEQPGDGADKWTLTQHAERVQERQVRLTAQRILAKHLRPGESTDQPIDTFWPNTDLDLTGATLIDLNLRRCQPHGARFSGATFIGDAWFADATFTGDTWFNSATFTEDAVFNGAMFAQEASFGGATFTATAQFNGAKFTQDAWFADAKFTGDIWFDKTTFTRDVWFVGVTFTGDAWFDQVTFAKGARFNSATFTSIARFDKATFTRDAWFTGATFTKYAWFGEATFATKARFNQVTFMGDARFDEATFSAIARFDEALVKHRLTDLSPWPNGWQLSKQHVGVEGREGTWHSLEPLD
jgi:uncharacterized protein YjbI with pentapeptide repeats